MKRSNVFTFPNGQQVDVETIMALRRKAHDEIEQMLAASTDAVLTVEEGVALFPGEGSQPACGYHREDFPANFTSCNLPRDHKPPHVCRVKTTP